MSEWEIRSKSEQLALFFLTTLAIRLQSLIPSEWPEWIAHSRSFVLSNLSDLLTSLRRNEQIFCFKKNSKNIQKYDFFWIFLSYSNCSFFVSKRENERFAHLLICPEWPEQMAHICSFVMSNLSVFLTVAHLSWATWANWSHLLICPEQFERMSKWAISKWANSQPWPQHFTRHTYMYIKWKHLNCLFSCAFTNNILPKQYLYQHIECDSMYKTLKQKTKKQILHMFPYDLFCHSTNQVNSFWDQINLRRPCYIHVVETSSLP